MIPTITVKILDGNTFVVSDDRGDIEASLTDPTGLFSFDTRFLSRWVLTVNGERLTLLSVDDLQYFESRFFLVPGTGTVYIDAKMSVIRHRTRRNGFHEQLTILNHDDQTAAGDRSARSGVRLRRSLRSQGRPGEAGDLLHTSRASPLRLAYQRDTFVPGDHDQLLATCAVDERGLTFQIDIAPTGSGPPTSTSRSNCSRPSSEETSTVAWHGRRPGRNMADDLARWQADAPRLVCDWQPLLSTYRRTLVDLAALRFSPISAGRTALPAAGLPWFMTLFGRDSIFTSLQALPFAPQLAATTLRELACARAPAWTISATRTPAAFSMRCATARLTAFEQRPHSPYYGSADATPLFVVLLDEYERWTGDTKLVRELESEARAAPMDRRLRQPARQRLCRLPVVATNRRNSRTSAGRTPGTRSPTATVTLPCFPRATCELQGYAYDAKVRAARLARLVWRDPAFADSLEQQAADLKRRFNRDFWIADGEYFAVALDADGTPVDSLTSNNGHLLWSGIVDKSKAKAVARHLLGDRLFSGWGIRTLADRRRPLQPHRLSRRHDLAVRQLVHRVGVATIRFQGGSSPSRRRDSGSRPVLRRSTSRGVRRLPPHMTKYPVQYPTACSPQAWSTGAPMLLLRTMLGLEPIGDNLMSTPRYRQPSAASNCSTSPAAGAASTPSAAAESTLLRPVVETERRDDVRSRPDLRTRRAAAA